MEINKTSSALEKSLYELFSSNDFDYKNGLNLKNLQISDEITKINDGIEQLNQEISELVCGNYKEFVDRVKKIAELESNFELIHLRVLNLLGILNKLRSILSTPYKDISQRITLLNRLQTTCDLLRRIIRIFSLSSKLEKNKLDFEKQNKTVDLAAKCKELVHKALWINEINQLLAEDSLLNKINVIQTELIFAKKEQENINEITLQLLENSLINQDINLLTISLQTFNLFNNLQNTLDKFLKDKEDLFLNNLKLTFDSKTNQTKIWIKIENFFIDLNHTFSQASLLFRILKKKRDALNQNILIENLHDKLNLNSFYEKFFHHFKAHIEQSCIESQVVKQIFDNEYPKLFKIINEINKKNLLEDDELDKQFRKFLLTYETAYLSRCLTILFDLVNNNFSDSTNEQNILNIKDIDNLLKQISFQLTLDVDLELGKLLIKNICQCINLFLVKCEEFARVGPDSTQVIGHVTESQRLNAKIVHRLSTFQQQMNNILMDKTMYSKDILNSILIKLKEFDTLIINIVTPFFESINDAISAILLSIHSENFGCDNFCSLYMRELHGFFLRIQNDYLKLYPKIEVINNFYVNLAIRCMELFLRHISILRQNRNPDNIRRKLAIDCDQLEQAIFLLGVKSSDLGKNYRILRAFKPFLSFNLNEIVNSPVVGSIIPYSMVIQYLIAAFAKTDFQLPHEAMGWSVARYCKWCDENAEEMIKLIILRDCLDNYAKEIGHDLKTFPPIYTNILKLLDTALK